MKIMKYEKYEKHESENTFSSLTLYKTWELQVRITVNDLIEILRKY